jgi:hypothetical protein
MTISSQTHLADEVLEALVADRGGTREAEVVVDHHHLLFRPAWRSVDCLM